MSELKPDTIASKKPVEEWRQIAGWEGLYEVSSMGRVRRLISCRTKDGIIGQKKGVEYPRIVLMNKGRSSRRTIHRLVAEAFIPNPLGYPQLNHVNGDKHDSRVCNLQWCTQSQNRLHAIYVLGIGMPPRGIEHPLAKLNPDKVLEIRASKLRTKGIAAKFGVSYGTISAVRKRRRWGHVK